ncbi:hypothetical protein JW933_09465 [candidate division FCPU426 bacterium]|nr:hypothetical protein [candidate division FCPU426 bacterium]
MYREKKPDTNKTPARPASANTALSLQIAGIRDRQAAREILNRSADYVAREGTSLVVHLVNWYRYHPENMRQTLFWNGDAGRGGPEVVLTSKPLFGYYSCQDQDYMEWVCAFSRTLGVTEFNVDYEGGIDFPDSHALYYQARPWDSWLPLLLDCAAKHGLHVSVMYEGKSITGRLAVQFGSSRAKAVLAAGYTQAARQVLADDLKRICDQLAAKKTGPNLLVPHPAYRRLAGLPVIWIFGAKASGLSGHDWQQVVEDLRNQGYFFVLVPNTHAGEKVAETMQGMNPWLDQIFSGFVKNYREWWEQAQKAAAAGDIKTARSLGSRYIDEIYRRGLSSVAPVGGRPAPAGFRVAPLAIGFQDAAVNGWGLRPPVYIESRDRTRTEPGRLFRTYFQEAQNACVPWNLVASGDDICERTHMLIPDEEYGFSGPYAIALTAACLGKKPDLVQAIRITENFIRRKNRGNVPAAVQSIISEALRILPDKLQQEYALYAPPREGGKPAA